MTLANKEDDDEMTLRGSATDAASAIATAVGKETFAVSQKLIDNVVSHLFSHTFNR